MWWIIVFIALYLLVYFCKAVRDFIMFHQQGLKHWETSVFYNRIPKWLEDFLLDRKKYFGSDVIDGWHMLDGIIVQLPKYFIITLLTTFILGVKWFWIPIVCVVSFVVGYQYFNLLFHKVLRK